MIKNHIAINRNNIDSILEFLYPYDKEAIIFWDAEHQVNFVQFSHDEEDWFLPLMKNAEVFLIINEQGKLEIWTSEEFYESILQ